MKKLVYSLSLVMLVIAGCISFDDAVTENYGAGPSVAIDIQAGVPADSAFTIYLTPSQGTTYYSYIIDESDEAEELDPYTLLKCGYSGAVLLNTATTPKDTIIITDATPNTTYQIYAVASNEKGVAGKVAVAGITTTDVGVPRASRIARDAANKAATVTFSEALTRGTGKVTAKYYKEWDIMNPVDLTEDEITVEVSGSSVKFGAPTAPNGATVAFSWEAGAFKDLKGNNCTALNSGLNMTTGLFTNVYFQVPTAPFSVTDDNIVSPENGALIADWTTFAGVIKFDKDIYRYDAGVVLGDLTVTYAGSDMNATIKLAADDWSVQDSAITFSLPKAPAAGDIITVQIVEGAVTDVLGNPNAAFSSKVYWKYFAMTKDMAVGNFEINYISYWGDGNFEVFDSITIEFDSEVENGLIIKGLLFDDSEIKGSYDLDAGEIYIPDWQKLGSYYDADDDKTYALMFSTYGVDEATFTVNADGTMESTDYWGVYYTDDATMTEEVGWYDLSVSAVLVPYTAAPTAPLRAASTKPFYSRSFAKVLNK